MCYYWYTRRVIIRTIRGKISKGNTLIAFAVIGDDFQMIIKDIDGINKCFDNVTAEARISAVALCELMQEEKNAVPVDQLGL